MQIRPATLDDLATVGELLRHISKKASVWATDNEIRTYLTRSDCRAFVSITRGKIRGCIFARLEESGKWMLYHLAVERRSRRKGVATNLVKRMLRHLRAQGVTDVWLAVAAGNNKAFRFWSIFGEKVGEPDEAYEDVDFRIKLQHESWLR